MTLKTVATAIKLALGIFFGWFLGLHTIVQLLVFLMLIDVLVGMIAAGIDKTLNSDVAWKGLLRKVIVLFLIAVAELVDHYIGLGQFDLGEIVAGFYCAHEGLSILENAVRAGLPIPQALRDALAKLSPEKFEGDPGGKLVG